MRRCLPIVKATALEMLSEPLSLLLLLAGLTLSTMAPAFHYHQFGEATRMARDAGLSALFTCGLVFSVVGTVKSIRREIETGTAQMALVHPITRTRFFLSKVLGAFVAYLAFGSIVFTNAAIIVNGAAIGGVAAAKNADIARLWGPSFAIGVGVILLPLVVGAVLNRFARFRFVLTSFFAALACVVSGVFYRFDAGLFGRLLPLAVLQAAFAAVFVAAAGAAATRLKANAAIAAVSLLFAAALPFVGNYYLPDALSDGGCIPWRYVGLSVVAALTAIAAFLTAGIHLVNGRDMA